MKRPFLSHLCVVPDTIECSAGAHMAFCGYIPGRPPCSIHPVRGQGQTRHDEAQALLSDHWHAVKATRSCFAHGFSKASPGISTLKHVLDLPRARIFKYVWISAASKVEALLHLTTLVRGSGHLICACRRTEGGAGLSGHQRRR